MVIENGFAAYILLFNFSSVLVGFSYEICNGMKIRTEFIRRSILYRAHDRRVHFKDSLKNGMAAAWMA